MPLFGRLSELGRGPEGREVLGRSPERLFPSPLKLQPLATSLLVSAARQIHVFKEVQVCLRGRGPARPGETQAGVAEKLLGLSRLSGQESREKLQVPPPHQLEGQQKEAQPRAGLRGPVRALPGFPLL